MHPRYQLRTLLVAGIVLAGAPVCAQDAAGGIPDDSPARDALLRAKASADGIVAISADARTFDNTVAAIDDLLAQLEIDTNMMMFMAYVSTDGAERSRGNCGVAVTHYEKILSIEPEFALVYYLAAECLRELRVFDRARDYYHKAQDRDVNPYRVLPVQNEILEKLSATHDVPRVDAPSILAQASPDGMLGYNLMWDNCHPTLEAYARIALGFVEQVEKIFDIQRQIDGVDVRDIAQHFSLTEKQEFQILIGSGQFMYRYATLVWDPAARLARAEHYFEAANALIPDSAEYFCAKATLSAFHGDRNASLGFWQDAHAIDPDVVRERLKNRDLLRLLKRIGFDDEKDLARHLERRAS